MTKGDDPGPLIPLSGFWRVFLALAAVIIAVLHLLFPDLAIDALFVGLLVAGGALLFFDVDSFEFAGLKARRQHQQLEEAKEELLEVEVASTLPPAPTPPATDEPGFGADATLGEGGLVHRPPVNLTPPVDRLERLLWGYEQMRIELIVLAASGGQLPERKGWEEYQATELASHLISKDVIPSALLTPIVATVDVRNAVVHGHQRPSTGLVRTASDVAVDTLAKLRAVKRHYIRILDPHVPVYRDQSLSALIQETAAVMIAQIEDDGTVSHVAVYPRLHSYIRGRFVSWEWDMARVFKAEAWYQDPKTRAGTMAWGASATFTGREFPTQWGLEFRLPRPDIGLT